MHEYTVCTWCISLCSACDIYLRVSKFVTMLQSLCLSGMTNRHGQWVFWMSMGGKNDCMKHTQQCRSSAQQDGGFWSRQSHLLRYSRLRIVYTTPRRRFVTDRAEQLR